MEFKRGVKTMETKIIKINPKNIKLLDVNARYMNSTEYQKLVNNIKKDNKLTSVPFCYYNPNNEIEVLSGNHRVMASIDAGLDEIEIMLCLDNLSKEQALAIQLSHNSINGQDDDELLKELYSQLETLEYKEYSGLADDFIKFCKDTEKNFKIPNLNYQAINLIFLPEEIAHIKEVLTSISTLLNNNYILANMKEYDEYLNTITNISKCLNIKNPATTFLALIELAKLNIDKLKKVCFKDKEVNFVPLSVILGRSDCEKKDAVLIEKALNKMISRGEIKKSQKEKGHSLMAEMYINQNKF